MANLTCTNIYFIKSMVCDWSGNISKPFTKSSIFLGSIMQKMSYKKSNVDQGDDEIYSDFLVLSILMLHFCAIFSMSLTLTIHIIARAFRTQLIQTPRWCQSYSTVNQSCIHFAQPVIVWILSLVKQYRPLCEFMSCWSLVRWFRFLSFFFLAKQNILSINYDMINNLLLYLCMKVPICRCFYVFCIL